MKKMTFVFASSVLALSLGCSKNKNEGTTPVENTEVALGVFPYDELAAESMDRVRLPVPEGVGEAEAMPTAGVPLRHEPGVDRADGGVTR